MTDPKIPQAGLTLKLVWVSLTFSMYLYGFVLFTQGKLEGLSIPESYGPIEIVALLSTLVLFVTFNIHEKRIKTLESMEKRFAFYVICWALHEFMVVVAFAAVLTNESGNFLVYALNLGLATFGNLLTFPRKPD